VADKILSSQSQKPGATSTAERNRILKREPEYAPAHRERTRPVERLEGQKQAKTEEYDPLPQREDFSTLHAEVAGLPAQVDPGDPTAKFLADHENHIALHKLRQNEPLTRQDLDSPQYQRCRGGVPYSWYVAKPARTLTVGTPHGSIPWLTLGSYFSSWKGAAFGKSPDGQGGGIRGGIRRQPAVHLSAPSAVRNNTRPCQAPMVAKERTQRHRPGRMATFSPCCRMLTSNPSAICSSGKRCVIKLSTGRPMPWARRRKL